MPGHRGQVRDIKAKVHEMFSEKLNEAFGQLSWEMTFAKTFSRHKSLFIKSSAIYQLDNIIAEGAITRGEEDLQDGGGSSFLDEESQAA